MARWVCVFALISAVGCNRGADTEENVRRALDQANMQVVEVQVDDDASVVHLKGTVDTMGERTRAQEVASAAVGTTGRVLNELTVKGLTDQTADDFDDDIEDKLDRTVDNDPVLKERDIEFDVVNGMVTIRGEVASAGEKAQAEQLAKAAPGVKDVANALEIKAGQ